MKRYRITTNGIRYRIEEFTEAGWFSRAKWQPMGRYRYGRFWSVVEYDSFAKAESEMCALIEEAEAKDHGWTVVERKAAQ